MIKLKEIKGLIDCDLSKNASDICSSIFSEEPISYRDEDLDETYLICKNSGVSILYGDEGQFESLFFHFQGDEDTDNCNLNVFGLTAISVKDDLLRLLIDQSILREIKDDVSNKSSIIYKIDDLICNAEFNNKDQLILLAVMIESSYPESE